MRKRNAALLIIGFAVTVAATSAGADTLIPGYKYTKEKVQTPMEGERVTATDPKGVVREQTIYFIDGSRLGKVFRADGTLKSSTEVRFDGHPIEKISYDATGKTVSHRQSYRIDGTLEWESARKADGHTLHIEYYPGGKLWKVIELFDKNGFSKTTYRKDGSKWHGSERKPGESGRGTDLYYEVNGINLKRTQRGTFMTVVVCDKGGKELYTQQWLAGIDRYQLTSVKETVPSGGHRVINVRRKKVTAVDYFKADGTLDRTEQPNAISIPVDVTRLQELAAGDDPTIPFFYQER